MKRYFFVFILLSLYFFPSSAHAIDVKVGELVKLSDRPEIFYVASNMKRYHIPDPETYFSWYKDFSKIRVISRTDLFSIPASTVRATIRPGTRLVMFDGSPHVYAVDTGARLRWIDSEITAFKRFGLFWFVGIAHLPKESFADYELGDPIASDSPFSRARAASKSPSIDQELRVRGYIPPRKAEPDRSNPDSGFAITLKGLRENVRASLSPRFNPNVTHYTLDAKPNERSIKFRPLRTSLAHVVKINGAAVLGGNDVKLPLQVGVNHFEIVVSNRKGESTTYTVDVTRESASSNADLVSIRGNLKHNFDHPVDPGRFEYNINADFLNDIWRMRVKTADRKATVYVNGKKSASGRSNAIRLNYGKNTTVIRIVSQAGTEKEYVVHVHRSRFAGVNDLDLKSLSENLKAKLSPAFSPKVSRYYMHAAPHESSVQIRATARNSSAQVYIDNRRARSKTIQLHDGKNEIKVRVQLGGQEKQYIVVVDRLEKRD